MRIGKFILTIVTFVSFVSSTASAAPENCSQRRSPTSGLNDVIKAANVTSDTDSFGNQDGRGTLTEKTGDITNTASGALVTEAEAAQIRKSTGWVVCEGKTHNNPIVTSAALVGSSMQVVTNVHAFIDKEGRKREPLSDCYFQNQDNPGQRIAFDFASGNFKFGTEGARKTGDPNDYAVVQLKEPVAGAIPFRASKEEVAQNEWIIGIAAGQESPTRVFPTNEPILQQCKVRDVRHNTGAPTQYFTDCDLSPLGSGGVTLTRTASGELSVKGIFATTGKQTLNGQPYDLSTGSFTSVVAVSEDFARDISQVQDSIPIRAAVLK